MSEIPKPYEIWKHKGNKTLDVKILGIISKGNESIVSIQYIYEINVYGSGKLNDFLDSYEFQTAADEEELRERRMGNE